MSFSGQRVLAPVVAMMTIFCHLARSFPDFPYTKSAQRLCDADGRRHVFPDGYSHEAAIRTLSCHAGDGLARLVVSAAGLPVSAVPRRIQKRAEGALAAALAARRLGRGHDHPVCLWLEAHVAGQIGRASC